MASTRTELGLPPFGPLRAATFGGLRVATFRGLRLALLALLACGLLAGPPAADALAAGPCGDTNARPGEASEQALSQSTVCLLNRARAKHGLRSLQIDARLSKAAHAHSRDMVRKHYFGHVSRKGKDVVDRLTRTGYLGGARSWTVGENIAWGAGSRSTPREIVSAWMHSAGHRHNILTTRFREIGIGVVFDTPADVGAAGATYTTTFGARG